MELLPPEDSIVVAVDLVSDHLVWRPAKGMVVQVLLESPSCVGLARDRYCSQPTAEIIDDDESKLAPVSRHAHLKQIEMQYFAEDLSWRPQ